MLLHRYLELRINPATNAFCWLVVTSVLGNEKGVNAMNRERWLTPVRLGVVRTEPNVEEEPVRYRPPMSDTTG
jgi:hypothetical protein